MARAMARQPTVQQPAPHLHQNIGDLLLDFNIIGSFLLLLLLFIFNFKKDTVLEHGLFAFPAAAFT